MFLKSSVCPRPPRHTASCLAAERQSKQAEDIRETSHPQQQYTIDRTEPHMAGVARIDTLHLYTRLER